MSLINIPDGAPDLEQKKAVQKKLIQDGLTASFINIKSTFVRLFNQVWKNQAGLSPQEVMDALGTDAAQLFVIASTFQAAMNAVKPGALPQTPPLPVTINNDGTVTIGDPA